MRNTTLEFTQENWEMVLDRIQYLKREVKKYKYDFLTSLRLRKDFDSYFSTLFEMYEFEDRPFALLLIDVVNLHNINRVQGYSAGDELLKEVANQLKVAFIECNGTEVFRIGGDEFTVLVKLPEENRLVSFLDTLNNVTYSYVICDPKTSEEFASPAQILKLADKRLLERKTLATRV